MQSLHTTSLPAGLDNLFTATGALAMRDVCCKSGKYDGQQAVRIFRKARDLSFDTLITADDVLRAWNEVGIQERVLPHIHFFGVHN
jgi:hypothetical protein